MKFVKQTLIALPILAGLAFGQSAYAADPESYTVQCKTGDLAEVAKTIKRNLEIAHGGAGITQLRVSVRIGSVKAPTETKTLAQLSDGFTFAVATTNNDKSVTGKSTGYACFVEATALANISYRSGNDRKSLTTRSAVQVPGTYAIRRKVTTTATPTPTVASSGTAVPTATATPTASATATPTATATKAS